MRKVFAMALAFSALMTLLAVGATGTSAKETVDAGKEYTSEKKNEFETNVRGELKKLDAQMDKIQKNIEKSSSDVKERGQKEWEKIKAQRDELSQKLDELSKSSGSAWSEVKKGVTSAIDELSRSVKKAKGQFK